MLFQCAYTELVVLDAPWPDFTRHHLADAMREYGRRRRTFGRRPHVADDAIGSTAKGEHT